MIAQNYMVMGRWKQSISFRRRGLDYRHAKKAYIELEKQGYNSMMLYHEWKEDEPEGTYSFIWWDKEGKIRKTKKIRLYDTETRVAKLEYMEHKVYSYIKSQREEEDPESPETWIENHGNLEDFLVWYVEPWRLKEAYNENN